MGEGSEKITGVKIYNQTYHVRSGGDAEWVRKLASYVNEKWKGFLNTPLPWIPRK